MAISRFVNNTLSELQGANRSPIFGYEDLPLLTLEEAVEKIIPLVPRVMDHVARAKQKCNRHSTLLTWDESASIYLYSMPISLMSILNDALRTENRHALKPWFAFLKLFITALEKLPLTKGIVYRGVNYNDTLTYEDNDVHIWWSVNSCSTNPNIVQPFLGESGTLFIIDAIYAKDISAFSALPDEQEVILMPGTRVCRKNDSLNFIDRLFILHLEEINPQSESQPESNYLFEQIRQEYQRNNRLQRILNPAKSFPIEQSYINLAIVKAEDQHEKEKQLRETQPRHVIMNSFEEIYGMKTGIEVKDIFQSCKESEKQVLVFGRAGIGKSTFCRYIAYQWAKGSYWSQYELLALIPLRRLITNRYPPDITYNLIDLVKKEVFPYDLTEKEETLLKNQFDAKKTLWILDGYDEIVQNVPPHLERLLEQLLKTPHHILTSRPYLNTLSYDVQMEITGFTDKNIEEYVQKFFHQMKDELDNVSMKSATLLKFLQSNRSIWGVSHIPVNLELICSLWSNQVWSETEQLTITTLYNMITEWLCRRYLRTHDKQTLQLSKKKIDQLCQNELSFLESLAFIAMENNTIIIRPTLLKKALEEAEVSAQEYPHILKIGILKSFNKHGIGTQIETDKDHYFVHISFQEYFAARYLINSLKGSSTGKAIEFIRHQKYNERYTLIFSFASSLLCEDVPNACLDIFWDVILGEPLDLVGVRHMQLITSCLEETSNKSIVPGRIGLLEWIANCIQYSFHSVNQNIRKQLSYCLERAPSVVSNKIIINVLINLLHHNHTDIKTDVLSIICALKISNPSTVLIVSIITTLTDKNDKTRASACQALRMIGEKAATSEMISKLVSALEDQSEDVRKSACDALGVMGEKAITDEAIRQLVSAVGDESENVRKSAYEALGTMAGKTAPSEVIRKLVSLLENESEYVRASTCQALGMIGKKVATSEVISKLVSALGDGSKRVRACACQSLQIVGEEAASNEMIDKLVIALGNEREYVRASACQVLGMMYKKAATNEVISKLASALGDQSEDVRASACIALGMMSETVVTNKVISKLVIALADDSIDVRRSACLTLGKMGGKAATKEVINRLVAMLGDVDDLVRKSANLALEKMSETTVINDVITSLVASIVDTNWMIRRSACDALGKLGQKAATNDIVNRLVTALTDENWEVRWSACEAIGVFGEKVTTDEVIDTLTRALRDENVEVRESAWETIGRMGEKAANSNVINRLVTALWETHGRVRSTASRTLGEIGVKATPDDFNKLIKTLVTASNDGNPEVRQCAWEIIGTMSEKVAIGDVINRLVIAFADENPEVRRSVCRVVTKMDDVAADVIINGLVTTLEDGDVNVRLSACQALKEVSEKVLTDKVITALVTALGDSNPEVRSIVWDTLLKLSDGTAINDLINRMAIALESQNTITIRNICKILTKMGEKAATNEIIHRLVVVLVDQNPEVRWNACNTLGEMGEKAATREAINGLVTALKDNNGQVRSNACEALGKMGEKAVTNDVIIGLMNALTYDQDGVKVKACVACGRLGEKAVTVGMIDRLLVALRSENPEVRQSACDTLGKMGEKAARDDIINRLVTALVDKNLDVRRSACETLGKMGEKAVSNEVINRLVTILEDDNADVELYPSDIVGGMDEKTDAKDGLVTGVLDTQINDMDEVVKALNRMLTSFSAITQLHPDTILNLYYCINRLKLSDWIAVPAEHFIRVFLYTKHYEWLAVVTTIAFFEGNAVSITKNTIRVYGSKECVELDIPSEELRQQLVEAFFSQAIIVQASSEMLSKDGLKPEDVNQIQAKNVGEVQVTDNNPATTTTDQLSRNPRGTISSLEFTSTAESMTSKSDSNNLEVEQSTKETNAAEACIDDIVVKLNKISLSPPHVRVIKSEDRTDRISVQAAPSCCIDLIGLTLTDNTQCILDETISSEIINLNRDVRTEIVCLDVDSSSIKPAKEIYYKCQSFSNDLDCVSYVLSNKPREEKSLIYFVTSSTKGKFIAPLIHNQSCVERIYVFDDVRDNENFTWTANYSKISGHWSSFDMVREQLTNDIMLMTKRPSRWTRSQELFIELWTQQPLHVNMSFTGNVEEQTSNTLQIVTLFCDAHQRFYLSHNGLDFPKFDDIQRCSDLITEREIPSIFLVICGVSNDNLARVRSLIDRQSIHTAYIFVNTDERHTFETNPLCASSKISGVFASHNLLLVQLATDICFYRQIFTNIPKMSLLRTNSEVLAHLEEYEKEFLRYQLFIAILPELLSATNNESELCQFINVTDPALINIELCQKTSNIFKKCDLHTILQSKPLVLYADKDIRSIPWNMLCASINVYRAQLISDDDLNLIRTNPTAHLSILSYIIVSQSYPSVIKICRQAIDNGLTIVLFEIKLFKGMSAKRISTGPDIFVFPLGTMFRLKSIEPMPDNVWHVQAELSNFDLQYFKDQLRFRTRKSLTSSTITDYWTVLDRFGTIKSSDE